MSSTSWLLVALALGIWLNFLAGALSNHCQFTTPGVSLSNFNLTPGQSDAACLSKPKGR